MSDLVRKIQTSSLGQLSALAQLVVNDGPGAELFGPSREQLLEHFIANINRSFDQILDHQERAHTNVDFNSLSLVQEDELNAMVATGSMVNLARHQNLAEFIRFNTRLNTLVAGKQLNESTNPLDPQQILTAFTDALRTTNSRAKNDLDAYQRFNELLLKQLGPVLQDANQAMIENGILPQLTTEKAAELVRTRAARRAPARPSENVVDISPTAAAQACEPGPESLELFGMMQNLLRPARHPGAIANDTEEAQHYSVPTSLASTAQAAERMPFVATESVTLVDQHQLFEILTSLQQTLQATTERGKGTEAKPEVSKAINDILAQGSDSAETRAVDQQSADVINLVSLLYEAIWQDSAVAPPIKELISRTQITIIKVALADTSLFNREDHPARSILNEFAAAAIGWTSANDPAQDPLYQKMSELVLRLLNEFNGDIELFDELIEDFRQFRARESAKTHRLEQRILRASASEERLDDIHELVDQKITERLLGRDLPNAIHDFLYDAYHKFMVMLVLKEGLGSNAWKQAINTIDVLLWSVQPKSQNGDLERLEMVNHRLLNNLRKALRIANLEAAQIDSLIADLTSIQQATFVSVTQSTLQSTTLYQAADIDAEEAQEASQKSHDAVIQSDSTTPQFPSGIALASEADLHTIDQLSVGVWVEFCGESDSTMRCKLAAKIKAIDKYIFVNQRGIKVVEKTCQTLAVELGNGTLRLLSEGLLFSRALESVIGNLRASQQAQGGDAFVDHQPPKPVL